MRIDKDAGLVGLDRVAGVIAMRFRRRQLHWFLATLVVSEPAIVLREFYAIYSRPSALDK